MPHRTGPHPRVPAGAARRLNAQRPGHTSRSAHRDLLAPSSGRGPCQRPPRGRSVAPPGVLSLLDTSVHRLMGSCLRTQNKASFLQKENCLYQRAIFRSSLEGALQTRSLRPTCALSQSLNSKRQGERWSGLRCSLNHRHHLPHVKHSTRGPKESSRERPRTWPHWPAASSVNNVVVEPSHLLHVGAAGWITAQVRGGTAP